MQHATNRFQPEKTMSKVLIYRYEAIQSGEALQQACMFMLLVYIGSINFLAAIDDWADVGTKMTGGSISLSYPKMTRLTKDEQLYSNRYVRHPKFSDGKTWYTVDSFGPLGNNKFSSGTYPITASVN